MPARPQTKIIDARRREGHNTRPSSLIASSIQEIDFMALFQDARKSLFESGGQHRLTVGVGNLNYWFTFVSDPTTVGFLLLWEIFILRTSLVLSVISFAAGLFSWSLLEYSFHRWVYHKGPTLAHAGHKVHHQSPEVLIAMPWFIVTVLFLSLWYVFAYRLQLSFISGFMAGVLTGFVLYGLFHHVIHHHFNLKYSWYRKLRTQHFIHHQFPAVNFGVTSRLWDHVFGTAYKKEVKRRGAATTM
jgi:sterol desaturase/sphingolipid hydroxylase (fatty acid hydroxylase superfamily)